MAKIRVYELARELKLESKALLSKLKTLNIEVASHQSTLTDQQVTQVMKAEQAGDDGKPKVVIRRRKKRSETSQSEADVSVAPSNPVEDSPGPNEAEVVAQPKVGEIEEKSIQEPDVVVEKVEKQADFVKDKSEKVVEKTPEVVAKSDSEKVVEEKVGSVPSQAISETPAKPRFQGGATIVRKATVEEREDYRKSRQPSKPANRPPARPRPATSGSSSSSSSSTRPSSPSSTRPSLSPSTRPSSTRPSSTRPSSSSPTRSSSSNREPELESAEDVLGGAAREFNKKKTRERTTESEEERARQRAIAAKGKKRVKSTRELLEGISEEEVVQPVFVPKRKTVYTPSAGNRKRDHRRRKDLKSTEITTPRAAYRIVKMQEAITVGDLAMQMSLKAGEIIKSLMSQGIMATINQPLDVDTTTLIASEFGFEVKSVVKSVDDFIESVDEEKYELVSRPPIVTIMGHVDHGKTSILDALRKSGVAGKEAGGITQHIGAYSLQKNGKSIAFLDTPGHEAFSAMRSRGAEVTDLVVLVVAADDGVMPQTVEAISHAKQAGVPIIVAVNKIDKPGQNLDRVYAELSEHGVQSEEWGGENQFVKTSALENIGLDDLVDAIQLQAEMLELRAAPDAPGRGAVVEAHMEKGFGPVATILVTDGSVKKGDYIVVGQTCGRVRAMMNDKGKNQVKAGPGVPVRVIGLPDVPMAGDAVNVVASEKIAKEIAGIRAKEEANKAQARSSAQTLEDLLNKVKNSDVPEVPIIIKADTQGSVEALCETIAKLNTDGVKNKVIHRAVGGINESDLSLAQTSGAVILGFNVRAGRGLEDKAERAGVVVNYFSIIYELVDTVKNLMAGQLPPIQTEVIQGHAEVRDSISVPRIGTIAGSAVTDGKITRHCNLRLIREEIVIYDGKIGSLRRFKDDVKEVLNGYECGIGIDGYNDIKVGDVIEAYIIEETLATL